MWRLYYTHTNRKADRCQDEPFGQIRVSCSWVTTKCLWLQILPLFLFCLDCSCTPVESPISDSMPRTESLHAKPYFLVLKKISHAPEMQHSVTRIPVWKSEVLESLLKAHSMMKGQTISASFLQLYKQGRRSKRDVENLSQNNNTGLSELASTFTEILRKLLGQKTLSWPDLENTRSVASVNTRGLSGFSGELLRIDFSNDTTLDDLLKTPSSATSLHPDLPETQTPPPKWGPLPETQTPPPKLDNVVSQMHSLLDAKTFPAIEEQMLSTLKPTIFSKSEDMSSVGSLNKQEQAVVPDFKLFLVQSESTLPSTTQGLPYSNGKHFTKLNYTNLPGSPFPVTDATKVLTENGSHQSIKFTPKTSSGYTNNGLNNLPNSDLKTVDQYSTIHKPATDRFNLLDMSVHSKHATSTSSNMLIPGLETSIISLQNSDEPVTSISPTNSTLTSSTVSVNTKLYLQNSEPSSPLVSDSLEDYTPSDLTWDLASVTSQALDIPGLSSTKRDVETKSSLNTNQNTADISHITTQRMESSSVVDGTLFASSNLAVHVEQDSPAPSISHTLKTDQTSEHDRRLSLQRDTLRTFSASTWLSQTISTAEIGHSISWKTTPHTDFNTLSSVAQSPNQGKDKESILQINDSANTQTPKSSEALQLFTIYKSTNYESDTTLLSTSNSVTQNDGSTLVGSTFTDAHSEMGFQSTMTPPFEHDVFNDVMNDKISQSTFNLTSTLRSTMSSAGVTKPLTMVTSLWKTRTPQQIFSTAWPVHKIQSSKNTIHSTKASEVSPSGKTTEGQAHTLHKLLSPPVGTGSSRPPTTIPAALERTISTKSVADLKASSLKTSTYHHSTKNSFVSKILSTRDPMTAQQTSNSPRQPRTVAAMITSNYPKQHIVTGPLSSVTSKTQTASSTRTMKLLITSPTSRLTSLSHLTKISLATTTSTIKGTPAPKVWIPQTVIPHKSTIATPIIYSSRPKVSSAPTTLSPVVTMPLNFHLTGVSFTEQLTNRTSDEYRKLEREVKLVMDKILFAKYQNDYLKTEIKAFLRGSVIVLSNIAFQSDIYLPSQSDIIRAVLTDGTKTNYFGWSIDGSTVELNGYTQSNLELEVLPISLLVLRAGYIAVSQKNREKQSFLDNLQKAVFHAVNKSFPIADVSMLEIRDVYGDLKVRGNLYLNSTVHTNVQSLMSSLLPLVNRSVDLSSIVVSGIRNELQVISINFRVTNKQFVLNLLDMSSSESQLLSKDLSAVVQSVLHDSNPLQVIMREFKSGSVVCRGDLVYQLPAPGSGEVLRLLLDTLGSDGILGSSTYKVDSKSVTIGDSSPGPSYEYVDFPGFGVAIIVMCGLCILIFPITLFVCTKTRMLGHRNKATIQRRHDTEDRSHHFEMDNQAFRASIEQP